MSIWNKVLLGCIGLCAIVFAYMAVRALKIQQYWEGRVRVFQVALDKQQKDNWDVVEQKKRDNGNLGTRYAKLELDRLLVGRGRVWKNCERVAGVQVDRQTGKFTLTTDEPIPNGITDKMIVYILDEVGAQKGGQYLGEFKVVGVAEKKVAVEPTRKLDDDELERLSKSRGPWTLYEILPHDNHHTFADLSKEELKALLPAESLAEYAKDGKPAQAGDNRDPNRVDSKGNYVRFLRDYAAMYRNYRLQQARFTDLYQAAERDRQFVKEAYDDALLQEKFVATEQAGLKNDLAARLREAKAVHLHLAAVRQKLIAIQEDVKLKIKANLALAGEIAKTQLEAARRIDQRTRTIARGGAQTAAGGAAAN
jgi:hypothetical protein